MQRSFLHLIKYGYFLTDLFFFNKTEFFARLQDKNFNFQNEIEKFIYR